MSLGRSGPGVRSESLETPRTRFGGVFLSCAQTTSQSSVPGASTPRVRRRSEAVDIDVGQFDGRRLEECPGFVSLHDLTPVGGREGRAAELETLEHLTPITPSTPSPAPTLSHPSPASRAQFPQGSAGTRR